jgi:hypothetical protein
MLTASVVGSKPVPIDWTLQADYVIPFGRFPQEQAGTACLR